MAWLLLILVAVTESIEETVILTVTCLGNGGCYAMSIFEKMKMKSSLGVNLRVTGHCNQGDRKYMEDMFCVAYQQTEDGEDLEYAYFGIFDGHGGKEAAEFAREHLMEFIVNEKKFWSDNDEDVLSAIRSGYVATHYAMWKELAKWPKTASGLPSTSGTTATIAFIRNGKVYIGHVGDSSLVLGYQSRPGPPHEHGWAAKSLTCDHKPESSNEIKRIQRSGGKVKSKSGVPRVVWNRPRIGHKGPVRRSTPMDEIPFLAVARSLGDLWSYNSDSNQFVVSPEPDVMVLKIDTSVHRCLIFGTDGFWNMVTPIEAVLVAQDAEKHNEEQSHLPSFENRQCFRMLTCQEKMWINPSKRLVDRALRRWTQNRMRADNTSVLTLLLNPPCSREMNQTQKIISHDSEQMDYPSAAAQDAFIDDPRMSPTTYSDRPPSLNLSNFEGLRNNDENVPSSTEMENCLNSQDRILQGLGACCPLADILSPTGNDVLSRDAPDEIGSVCQGSSEVKSTGKSCEEECARNRSGKTSAISEDKPEPSNVQGGSSTPQLLERPASPSPISNPMAASTPAFPRTVGVSYPHLRNSVQKAVESLTRRGKMYPVKNVAGGAGPSDKRQGLPLSSNLESGSLLRGMKRRHSSVLDQRNVVSESRELKKRTRSEEKTLVQPAALTGRDVKYNSEDTENERVTWPSDWFNRMLRCGENVGSQENSGINFTSCSRNKWVRPPGSPFIAIRQARARSTGRLFSERREHHSRTLRSDTLAASQCRTLRSRNVDGRSTVKMQLSAAKLTPRRTVHLRPALSAELSAFARPSSLLQPPRGTVTSAKRKTRTVPTRSRV